VGGWGVLAVRPRPGRGGNRSRRGPSGVAEPGTRGGGGSGWVKRKGEWRGGGRGGLTRGGAQLTEVGRGYRVGPRGLKLILNFLFKCFKIDSFQK
jgi:hypothetical protein